MGTERKDQLEIRGKLGRLLKHNHQQLK